MSAARTVARRKRRCAWNLTPSKRLRGSSRGGKGRKRVSSQIWSKNSDFVRAARARSGPAHMDTHGPELVRIAKQQVCSGTMSNAAATCKVCHGNRAHHFCHTCSKSITEHGESVFLRSPRSNGRHRYARHLHNVLTGGD